MAACEHCGSVSCCVEVFKEDLPADVSIEHVHAWGVTWKRWAQEAIAARDSVAEALDNLRDEHEITLQTLNRARAETHALARTVRDRSHHEALQHAKRYR
jgi:hypothetical protein